MPKSFDVKHPEIIVADGAINTAVGLTLGWNVIGRTRGQESPMDAKRLLKKATGEIRVMRDYFLSLDEGSSGTVNSDSMDIDENVLSVIEQRCDMEVHEVPPHLLTHVDASAKEFARMLQLHVTAHVSIMDVPSEFKEIRLAAYSKSQSK